jgi:predicted phosphodiesterase
MNTYNFRSNNIVLLGDTHDSYTTKEILQLRVSDGSDVVHLGDVGLGFGLMSYSVQNAKSWVQILNKACVELDINLYLTRGNHDAPWVWDFDNQSNVFFLKDGDVGVFPNGKRALLVGGGISVDRCNRKHNYDYWIDEPTNVIDNVEKCDIVFSHDCPEEFNHSTNTLDGRFKWAIDKDPSLIEDCMKQRSYMSDIVRRSEANTIFYGHFHNNIKQTIDGVFGQCVDINELFFFDAEYDYTRTQ